MSYLNSIHNRCFVISLFIFLVISRSNQIQNQDDLSNSNKDDASLLRRIPGNCSNNAEFDCGEKCIPLKRFRDCHQDCNDGSDEVCWPGFVRCLPSETGCTCVKTSDASRLCPQRSENKFCSLPSQLIFNCRNGNCVPSTWVNDGKNDCGDWSDEKQLSALQPAH